MVLSSTLKFDLIVVSENAVLPVEELQSSSSPLIFAALFIGIPN